MANRSYKGRRLEIGVSVKLSNWWTADLDVPRSDVFWHTGDSGGRATRRARKGESTYGLHGDIKAVDPIGQPLIDCMVIECKRGYNSKTIADLLDAPKGSAEQQYEGWFLKAEASCRAAGSMSYLIIHKRDRREAIAWLPQSLWADLQLQFAKITPSLMFKPSRDRAVVGITLDSFLKNVKPAKIMEMVKGWKMRGMCDA